MRPANRPRTAPNITLAGALAGALALCWSACAVDIETVQPPTTPRTGSGTTDHPTDTPAVGPESPVESEQVVETPLGESELFPPLPEVDPTDPPEEVEPGVRHRRRMDIGQLDRAIRQATGGVGWDVDGESQFEVLAATLGRPDFLETTIESLEATPIFHKFLNDAARAACTELVALDLERDAEQRQLIVGVSPDATWSEAPEAVETNLARLLLRYHGTSVAPDSDELAPWTWLFESSTHVTGDPTIAWRTVCVGLITHSHFYSY